MYGIQCSFILVSLFFGVKCVRVLNENRYNNSDYESFQNDFLDNKIHSTTNIKQNDFSTTKLPVTDTSSLDITLGYNNSNHEAFQNDFVNLNNKTHSTDLKEISFSTSSIIDTSTEDVTERIPTTNIKNEMAAETSRPLLSLFDNGHLSFIDKLLGKYDKRAWPTYGTDTPTAVTVNIHINSLGPITAAHMEFGMDIYLRQSWRDPRLQFSQFGVNKSFTLNGQDLIEKLWKPDLFFRNLKSGNFHSVTVPNKLITLSPDGKILFSMRLTIRLSCQMSFRLYPLDTQRCWVILGSYAHTNEQVIVKWRKNAPISIEKDIEVPEFEAFLQEAKEFERHVDTGTFSFLNVSFVFVRQNGYHLIQTYLPTLLLVMMSWVSFWIPVEAAPARTALAVTTLLSLVTVASGIRTQLPPVSYAKAIDIWIGACSVMVFASLLEFAFSSYLNRMKVHHKKNGGVIFRKKGMKKEDIEASIQNDNPLTPEMIRNIQRRRSHTVDRLSRMIFPIVFLIFNMFYWIYYLTQRAKQTDGLL